MLIRETNISSVIMDGVLLYSPMVLHVNGSRAFYSKDDLLNQHFFVIPSNVLSYSACDIYTRFTIYVWFKACMEDAHVTFKDKPWWKDDLGQKLDYELAMLKKRVMGCTLDEVVLLESGAIARLCTAPVEKENGELDITLKFTHIGDCEDVRLLSTDAGMSSDATVMAMAVEITESLDDLLIDFQKHGAFKTSEKLYLPEALAMIREVNMNMDLYVKPYSRFLNRFVKPYVVKMKVKMENDKQAFIDIFHSAKHIDQRRLI